MEPYRSLAPKSHLWLPQTEALSRRVMSLPTGTAVGAEDVARICGIIRGAVALGDEVRRRAAARSDGKPLVTA